ncbi:hypothetical protein [Roseobacter sp. HKCCA0434]|uniref:hypothetical protein n=1 Tax=Roseobacter sp. HKCCA0434 TaxID=3079297 RepID=UPI002905D533|nr:hypothetical protein [Roseobacter sp. HKCCA0434]
MFFVTVGDHFLLQEGARDNQTDGYMKKTLIAALLCGGLAGCAATTSDFTPRIDNTYQFVGMSVSEFGRSDEPQSGVAFRMYRVDGQAHLCGISFDLTPLTRQAVRRGRVYFDDELIATPLGFLPATSYDNLPTAEARCINTGIDWKTEYARVSRLRLELPTRIEVR